MLSIIKETIGEWRMLKPLNEKNRLPRMARVKFVTGTILLGQKAANPCDKPEDPVFAPVPSTQSHLHRGS